MSHLFIMQRRRTARSRQTHLAGHGKVFESRRYPGESHGLRPAARIDMYRRAEEFFDRMLKGTNP